MLVVTWGRIRPRDIVVFQDPETRGSALIKRLQALTPEGDLVVRGDNPNVSRDSRHFGPVPPSLVIGRAVYRYLPGPRRGSL